MAMLLKADGTTEPITEELSLQAMQKIVGGYIEIVSLGSHDCMVVDGEGLLKHYPVNPKATALYRQATPYALPHSVIVGDVICCVVSNMGHDNEAYT